MRGLRSADGHGVGPLTGALQSPDPRGVRFQRRVLRRRRDGRGLCFDPLRFRDGVRVHGYLLPGEGGAVLRVRAEVVDRPLGARRGVS